MSTKETQLGFKYITIRGGQLVPDTRPSEARKKPLVNPKLDSWWERDVEEVFENRMDTWLSNRGARLALNAHENIEGDSYDLDDFSSRNRLIEELSSSNGYHFEAGQILEKAKKSSLILDKHRRGFLLDFVDDLVAARDLSTSYARELRQSILQTKLELNIPGKVSA